MFNRASDTPGILSQVLNGAAAVGINVNGARVYSWPQSWPNTSMGFGGICGQAISEAQTVLLICHDGMHVFHGGRYAYTTDRSPEFDEAFRNHRLPGKSEPKKFSVRQHAPPQPTEGSNESD